MSQQGCSKWQGRLVSRIQCTTLWGTVAIICIRPRVSPPSTISLQGSLNHNVHTARRKRKIRLRLESWAEAIHTNSSPPTCSTLIFQRCANKPHEAHCDEMMMIRALDEHGSSRQKDRVSQQKLHSDCLMFDINNICRANLQRWNRWQASTHVVSKR